MRDFSFMSVGDIPVMKKSSKRSDSSSRFLVYAAAMSLRKTDYRGDSENATLVMMEFLP